MADDPRPSWLPDRDAEPRAIEANWLFRLRAERFRSRATGRSHDFFVIGLADAVQVVALTVGRRVVLVRQFRAGSGRDSLEPPGGLIEAGEDALAAGVRELLEETGYAGDPPRLLGQCWSNPALLNSRITTILVANARRVAIPKPDPGEELSVEEVPARAIPGMIADGRIDHGLAVQGLLLWLVGELPGHPLSTPRTPRRPTRWTVAGLMGLVALSAVLALWARYAGVAAVAIFVATTGGSWVAVRWLDDTTRSVLGLFLANRPQRHIEQTLVVAGLMFVACLLTAALMWAARLI